MPLALDRNPRQLHGYQVLGQVLLFLLMALPAHGETVIAHWVADNQAEGLDGIHSSGIESATIQRGPGLVAATDFAGYYDAYSWAPDPVFPGVSSEDYFSIVVEPANSVPVTFDSISITFSDAGSRLGPRSLDLRWSVDGFAASLNTASAVPVFPDTGRMDADLGGAGILDETVTFRLYGYDSPGGVSLNAKAIFGLSNDGGLLGPGGESAAVVIYGDVIPESSTGMLFVAGGAFLGLIGLLRRTRCRM